MVFGLVTKSHPLCVLDIRILLLTKRTIRIRSSSCNVSQGVLFDLRGGIGPVTRFFLRVTSGKRRTSANVPQGQRTSSAASIIRCGACAFEVCHRRPAFFVETHVIIALPIDS